MRDVRFSLVRSVVGLGGQFFVVMFSMLFIFQLTNIILSRVQGPEAVTQYNIAYKYFNVLNMAANIILTRFGQHLLMLILREIIIGCVVR